MMFFAAIIFLLFRVCLARTSSPGELKCCPSNMVLDPNYYKCVPTTNWEEMVYSLTERIKDFGFTLSQNYGIPKCNGNGTFINSPLRKTILSKFSTFCFDKTPLGDSVVVGCIPNLGTPWRTKDQIAIIKCCDMGMSATPYGCIPTDNKFELTFYDPKNINHTVPMYPGDVDLIIPGCDERYPAEDFTLLSNGILIAEQVALTTFQFCMENIENDTESSAFICFQSQEDPLMLENRLVAIGIVISVLFLIATLVIYLCDFKKQNLFGQTLISHICSIIVAFSCLAILRLVPHSNISPFWCQFSAYLMLYSFLAVFFWLNVMSIDIWRTFRSLRQISNVSRKRIIKRFAFYSIYAWGTPLIITIVAVIEINYKIMPTADSLTLENCWLSRNTYGYHVFFIIPIAVLITWNCILFVVTAYHCYMVKSEINKKRDDKTKEKKKNVLKKKKQLVLSIKLFVVMGVTWSLEVISFLFRKTTPSYAWYITDTINTLYGVIIFVIFLLKKDKMQQCRQLICSRCPGKTRTKSNELRKVSGLLGPSVTSGSYCYTTSDAIADSSEQ